MAGTDDLWPRFHRVAATGFPTPAQIQLGCGEAAVHFKEEAEKTPGTYVDLEFADYPVRRPQCRWEQGSASTAICRFEQAEISWNGPSEEQLRRLKDRDWKPHQVRMVRVEGPSSSLWIAPDGCKPLPAG
jgi:hypothetical protein